MTDTYRNIMYIPRDGADDIIEITNRTFEKYIENGVIQSIFFDELSDIYFPYITDSNTYLVLKFSRVLTDIEINRFGKAICKLFKVPYAGYNNYNKNTNICKYEVYTLKPTPIKPTPIKPTPIINKTEYNTTNIFGNLNIERQLMIENDLIELDEKKKSKRNKEINQYGEIAVNNALKQKILNEYNKANNTNYSLEPNQSAIKNTANPQTAEEKRIVYERIQQVAIDNYNKRNNIDIKLI
jgi:hypothetical protein